MIAIRNLTIVLLLVFFSCNYLHDPIDIPSTKEIEVLGHGGMGARSIFYPFNSKESILKSFEKGADGTELDVQLTKDKQLVVYHNEFLESNTNSSGRVIDHVLSDLVTYEYDFFSLSTFNLCSLNDIKEYSGTLKTLNLECKVYPGTMDRGSYLDDYATVISSLARDAALKNKLLIESRHVDLLIEIRKRNADLSILYTAPDIESGKKIVLQHNFNGLVLKLDQVQPELVPELKNLGLKIALYGANTKRNNHKAVQLYPDYIQTDRISHLLKLLKR